MRLARWVFRVAGIYGVVVVAPMFFLEREMAPGAVHPVFFYAWVSASLAWQLLLLILSRDPIRFRPIIPVCVLQKMTAAIAIPWLFLVHRVGGIWLGTAVVDLVFGLLFVAAYYATGRPSVPDGA